MSYIGAMPIQPQAFTEILESKFPAAEIVVRPLAADNDHYAVEIISDEFRGLNRVAQHRRVHDALKGTAAEDLHALTITTRTLT